MRPNTPKRQRQMRRYYALRAEYLEAHPWCSFPLGCDQPATEIHHRRGRIGELLTDTRYWSGLCHSDHAWVTNHPRDAYELGISERRTGVA